MTNPVLFISGEQPPIETDPKLREWLSRLVININAALKNDSTNLYSTPFPINYKVEEFSSYVDQNPIGLDNPLQVNFGSNFENDDFILDSLGTITFKVSASFEVNIIAHLGRDNTNMESLLLMYGAINDVPENIIGQTIVSHKTIHNFAFTQSYRMEIDDTIKFYIARDGSGADDGGLHTTVTQSPSIPDIPSASIQIKKIE